MTTNAPMSDVVAESVLPLASVDTADKTAVDPSLNELFSGFARSHTQCDEVENSRLADDRGA